MSQSKAPNCHVGAIPGDGNGWPGGIRLSWPALGIVLSFLALIVTLTVHGQNQVQRQMERMEDRLSKDIQRVENKLDDHIASNPGR